MRCFGLAKSLFDFILSLLCCIFVFFQFSFEKRFDTKHFSDFRLVVNSLNAKVAII